MSTKIHSNSLKNTAYLDKNIYTFSSKSKIALVALSIIGAIGLALIGLAAAGILGTIESISFTTSLATGGISIFIAVTGIIWIVIVNCKRQKKCATQELKKETISTKATVDLTTSSRQNDKKAPVINKQSVILNENEFQSLSSKKNEEKTLRQEIPQPIDSHKEKPPTRTPDKQHKNSAESGATASKKATIDLTIPVINNSSVIHSTEASTSLTDQSVSDINQMKRNEEVEWLFRAAWAAFCEQAGKALYMYQVVSQVNGMAHLVIGSPYNGLQHLYVPVETIKDEIAAACEYELQDSDEPVQYIEIDIAAWQKMQLGNQEKIALRRHTFKKEINHWIKQTHLSERQFVIIEKSEHVCILIRNQDKVTGKAKTKVEVDTEMLFFRKGCQDVDSVQMQLQQKKYTRLLVQAGV